MMLIVCSSDSVVLTVCGSTLSRPTLFDYAGDTLVDNGGSQDIEGLTLSMADTGCVDIRLMYAVWYLFNHANEQTKACNLRLLPMEVVAECSQYILTFETKWEIDIGCELRYNNSRNASQLFPTLLADLLGASDPYKQTVLGHLEGIRLGRSAAATSKQAADGAHPHSTSMQ